MDNMGNVKHELLLPQMPKEVMANGLVPESSLEQKLCQRTIKVRLKLKHLNQLQQIHH